MEIKEITFKKVGNGTKARVGSLGLDPLRRLVLMGFKYIYNATYHIMLPIVIICGHLIYQ